MYYATTEELQQRDAAVQAQQELRKRAAAAEEAHKSNVSLFERMFLSLGSDAIKVAGSSHDAELAEARALAAGRWGKLLDLEAQVQRDEQLVAARGKRPGNPGDKMLADEIIRRMDDEYEAQTKSRRESVKQERELAVSTRKELEAFIVKR
jgi:hypothetical protein